MVAAQDGQCCEADFLACGVNCFFYSFLVTGFAYPASITSAGACVPVRTKKSGMEGDPEKRVSAATAQPRLTMGVIVF